MTYTNGSPQERIRRDAERMARARRRTPFSPLTGLGVFGVVGWSVAIPTVGGALLGAWLDRVAPQRFSWTLALILGGLVVGAILAWDWIARESRRTVREEREAAETECGND